MNKLTKYADSFKIEEQFEFYLNMVNLDNLDKDSVQYQEMRRVFYAACGQLLRLMRDVVGAMQTEEEAMKVLEDMKDQVVEFFKKEVDEQR